MMSTPLVSVLMPVYNGEPYLREAVESILNQTFTDFELLIIDDASTDRSPEIIRSYQDPRIRVIRNPTNRGVAYSRKKGLELAVGEYVAVLDADDVAFNDRLQIQADFLDANPDICLVGSVYEVIDEDGEVKFTQEVPTDPLTIRWKLLFGNQIGHSTVMFRRRDALDVGGYDEQVFAGEDFDLWVRLAARGKIAQLGRPVSQHRQYSRSLFYAEPVEVKDHFFKTVMKSIRLQTGQDISFEVAKCLFSNRLGNVPRSASNRVGVLKVYATIQNCLKSFIQSSTMMTRCERRYLATLAFEDIYRIANDNPSSYRYACWAAMLCLARYNLRGFFDRRFVKMTLVTILPARAIKILRRIRRLGSKKQVLSIFR